ncbi:hypothetical protein DSCO28_42250 [Desulfosarcina ovata subsp. sediminis]|uniref:Uncharacterized protein n=1 Tax=Desulfosarcina ovata subsp. sediminis TaxID=885957 RepID=A0A5K7ZTW7_9BACT|nr:hypothetical protein [Desulfosarcina ovata]BBO83659.1 hypothetical protein DSCO28_42250 [Desulfosarcina ovata subsp. sediminis]
MAHFGMSDFGLDRRLEDLLFRGQIAEVGFTPTDALHVLDKTETREAIDKPTYYRILGVTPERTVRYTRMRFFTLAAEQGHFGPFDKAFFFAPTTPRDPIKRDPASNHRFISPASSDT